MQHFTSLLQKAKNIEQHFLDLKIKYTYYNSSINAQINTESLIIQILQYDIESLISSEKNESRLKTKLVVFVKRHLDLLRYYDKSFHLYRKYYDKNSIKI